MACLASGPVLGQVGFTTVGTLGGNSSRAFGLSGDGRVVVGDSDAPGGDAPFRWSGPSSITQIGPPGNSCVAHAASYDGGVIVGSSVFSNGPIRGWRWTAAAGALPIGTLVPGGTDEASCLAVNRDGTVIAGSSNSQAFRWTQSGGMVGLGNLGGLNPYSAAWGISADGSVLAGFTSTPRGFEAFRWTQATGMTVLGDLPGGTVDGRFYALSADGSTAVGYGTSDLAYEATMWRESTGMVSLGQLPGGSGNAVAEGVSSDGSVIVGFADDGSIFQSAAFVWDAQHGMRDLNQVMASLGVSLNGWKPVSATSVSADGRSIAGIAERTGQLIGFEVRIPCPGAIPILLGAAFLARPRRR
jgi:probable HAF family extracellular repeat protein